MRQERSKPLVEDLEAWLGKQHAKLSRSSAVAKPIDYMLTRTLATRSPCVRSSSPTQQEDPPHADLSSLNDRRQARARRGHAGGLLEDRDHAGALFQAPSRSPRRPPEQGVRESHARRRLGFQILELRKRFRAYIRTNAPIKPVFAGHSTRNAIGKMPGPGRVGASIRPLRRQRSPCRAGQHSGRRIVNFGLAPGMLECLTCGLTVFAPLLGYGPCFSSP